MKWRFLRASGVAGLMLAGCVAVADPADEALPVADEIPAGNAVSGALLPMYADSTIGGRRLALCELERPARFFPLTCAITSYTATSGIDGRFDFGEVSPGAYAILSDSGSGDFDAVLSAWRDEPLRPGDWQWIHDSYLGLDEGEASNLTVPADTPPEVNHAEYAVDTLLFEGSLFIVAHEIDGDIVRPAIVEAGTSEAGNLNVPIATAQPIDRASVRGELGEITREEAFLIDREIAARWAAFIAGDDSQYVDTDAALVRAIREGGLYQIGNTFLTTIEENDGDLVKAMAYGVIDTQSGERIMVGWLDETTGNVIEARSGFELNVRDNPGEWTEPGPAGERFYHYGFSYYRAWDQILPDPLIAMIEEFYAQAPNHTAFFIEAYQTSASEVGGDMNRLSWTVPALNEAIRMYAPAEQAPPYLSLPDSGTVDVNRDRFLRAVAEGAVIVDRKSLNEFLDSDFGQFGFYVQNPDPQFVIDALLTPYRSGHLFNDMEAAIILDATYGGDDERLTIQISARLNQGVQVPRRTDKLIRVSRHEVANVILGYGGTLNARWPHEMSHILDFRYGHYPFGRVGAESRCEPLKYMLEFMWWVQRYPYDAPDEDWMPIGSGLTLSRLLTGYYPNSGC